MGLILRIAFRNMILHKGRSFAIGFVLLVGSFFMILGTGTIIGMKKGIERNIVKGTFGDITVLSNKRMSDTLSSSVEALEIIEQFKEINSVIKKQEYVNGYLPVIFERLILLDVSMEQTQTDYGERATFIGADMKKYSEIYGKNIEIIEGVPLKEGGKGLYVNTNTRDRLYDMYNIWLIPENGSIIKENLPEKALSDPDNIRTRSDLVVMGFKSMAMDVRVPIKGIFKHKNVNELLDFFNLMDIETMRESVGYISTDEMVTNLSNEDKALLDALDDSLDSFFDIPEEGVIKTPTDSPDKTNISLQNDAQNMEKDNSSEVYTLLQLNINDMFNHDEAVNKLNQAFKDAKLDKYVRAISWDKAWTMISNYVNMFSLGLKAFVYMLFFAAVLMITNALSMAAMERTTEIGTMRTVGARKGFVSKMFGAETILLSLIFGGLGILLGAIAIKVFASLKMTTPSPFFQILFGGSEYSPVLDGSGIITVIVQLLFITLVASIYPIIVARRITPNDAIRA